MKMWALRLMFKAKTTLSRKQNLPISPISYLISWFVAVSFDWPSCIPSTGSIWSLLFFVLLLERKQLLNCYWGCTECHENLDSTFKAVSGASLNNEGCVFVEYACLVWSARLGAWAAAEFWFWSESSLQKLTLNCWAQNLHYRCTIQANYAKW